MKVVEFRNVTFFRSFVQNPLFINVPYYPRRLSPNLLDLRSLPPLHYQHKIRDNKMLAVILLPSKPILEGNR